MSQDPNSQAQSPLESAVQIEPTESANPTTPRKRRRRRSFSQKAAQASRENGARSRGPITEAGKQRSQRSNLIHGARAKTDLILPEDRQAYDAIVNDFLQRFQPASNFELEFVEQMVSACWRRRRHSSVLQQLWNEAVTEVARDYAPGSLSRQALATKAHAKLLADNAPILTLEVAELRESRKFHNAVRHLRDQQKWERILKLDDDPGID